MNHPTESTRHSDRKFWANPIFRRYCRSRLRPQGLAVALLISVLIAGFLFFMLRAGTRGHTTLSAADVERAALVPLLILQGLILFVLGTAQVAGGMTAESDEGVIDYQRLIPMNPLSKVFGYLFGLPVREYAMVFSTLPFTAWALWKGEVAASVWLPVYTVFFSSALTYHLAGLATGTVVKNRRWAFLISIGLVFCLYTIIPQMARFGLVFFKYLTITPVLMENMPSLLPQTAGAIVATGQKLAPEVKFFNLDFSETVFTLFSQSGLILTFIVMLRRRWRRTESLLLGKLWAAGLFVWVQVLLLGNALPVIDSGSIFPTRELYRRIRVIQGWTPEPLEAVAMSGVYGLVTLLFLFILTKIITPSSDVQIRGWRRARKQGNASLPFLSDAATAFGFVLVMAVAGAGGWFLFTRALVESRWFPGHEVPLSLLGFFTAVMLTAALGFHALLEAKGGKVIGLAIIFVGVVPLMVGAILGVSSNRLLPAASWLIGISPASAPIYASGTLLSISELPTEIARSVPRAFYFWQAVSLLVTIWLIARLWSARKSIAGSAVAGESLRAGVETEI
ncbi:MAG: hypothetical protein ABIS50_06805 [Luteolibacter sp.]|uniref:hypothetical protein n=1 Tax=Luteolibacter sp. TaxID=1962973 RepID=UPI00326565DF